MKNVKRIRFTQLKRGSSDQWISLGGVRLYNKGKLIPSGDVISEVGTTADMQYMIGRADSKYHNHYLISHAILTTRSQTGNYPNNGYWIAADASSVGWFEVELKTVSDIEEVQWVQKPDSEYGARGVANPMIVDFYRADGTLIERITTEGNRTPNAISKLGVPNRTMKYLIENNEEVKYWTGSSWTPVPNTG